MKDRIKEFFAAFLLQHGRKNDRRRSANERGFAKIKSRISEQK
jgi:hypothetical protein